MTTEYLSNNVSFLQLYTIFYSFKELQENLEMKLLKKSEMKQPKTVKEQILRNRLHLGEMLNTCACRNSRYNEFNFLPQTMTRESIGNVWLNWQTIHSRKK